jgi:hypothetical protein
MRKTSGMNQKMMFGLAKGPISRPQGMILYIMLMFLFLLLPYSEAFASLLKPTSLLHTKGTPSSSLLAAKNDYRDGSMLVSRTYAPSSPAITNDTDDDDDAKEKNSGEENVVETKEFNVTYRIYRPMTMSSMQASPIVVLHGGPSVPSDYLFPLVNYVPYRSLIFYDQLGCGRSDSPEDINA